MLGTRRQCCGQDSCATLGQNSPLRYSLSFPLWRHCPRGHSEDVSHLPGTAGSDLSAATQGEASGDPALQLGRAGAQSWSAQPPYLCWGVQWEPSCSWDTGLAAPFIARETEAWDYRGMLGLLCACPPACQQFGVTTPATCPVPSRDPSSSRWEDAPAPAPRLGHALERGIAGGTSSWHLWSPPGPCHE